MFQLFLLSAITHRIKVRVITVILPLCDTLANEKRKVKCTLFKKNPAIGPNQLRTLVHVVVQMSMVQIIQLELRLQGEFEKLSEDQ